MAIMGGDSNTDMSQTGTNRSVDGVWMELTNLEQENLLCIEILR